ncbi:MAG: hypothetical protein R3D33_15335 [Hyphomicrobiaceae bacterium]
MTTSSRDDASGADATLSLSFAADTEPMRRALDDLGRLGDRFAQRMTTAFEAVVVGGKDLDDVLRSLVLSMSDMALDQALKPFTQALGSGFGTLLSGGATGLPQLFAADGAIAAPLGLSGLSQSLPPGLGAAGSPAAALSGSASPVVAAGGPVVTFNVQTPDVAGFRRSETQIAALMSRTLGSGQRNL